MSDEEDPQAEYLEIARVFLPELLSRLKDGGLIAPVEVLFSDALGLIGTWQVDGFGKFLDLSDTDRGLRRVRFPVDVTATDKNRRTWNKRIEKDELT